MAGEDVTSSSLESPPMIPLAPEQFTTDFLRKTADRVINATWDAGLPQWSWGEGVYLLSEVRYFETIQEQIPSRLLNWYAGRGALTSGHINNVAPGAAASRLHALEVLDSSEINSVLEKWVMDPNSATRAANGAVEHWPGGVWADTCYMMGTFLLNHGVGTKNAQYVEFIGEQLVAHIELLQNPNTKLFAHGSHKGESLWNYWGRGNAWMSLSCVEYLDACEALAINPGHAKANFTVGKWHMEMANLNLVKKAAVKLIYGGLPEGSIDSAVVYLEKARTQDPYFVNTYLELAKIYNQLHQPTKVIEVLTKMVKLPTRKTEDIALKAEAAKMLAAAQ